MAIRIRLGKYERTHNDVLGRSWIGYRAGMTEAEALEAGRGMWRLNLEVVNRERFVLVVGSGHVRAVGEILAVTEHGTTVGWTKALETRLLGPGHLMYDRYILQQDPLANESRNSIKYGELPEEALCLDGTSIRTP